MQSKDDLINFSKYMALQTNFLAFRWLSAHSNLIAG